MNAEVKLWRYNIWNISEDLILKNSKINAQCEVIKKTYTNSMYMYISLYLLLGKQNMFRKQKYQTRAASLIHGLTATK